jgi:hypothetical protein
MLAKQQQQQQLVQAVCLRMIMRAASLQQTQPVFAEQLPED